MNNKLRIRPNLLSGEELPAKVYGKELSEEQYKLLEETLKTGLIIATEGLLSLKSARIVRRNNLGIPRWRGNGHLPTSLDIQRAAAQALEGRD